MDNREGQEQHISHGSQDELQHHLAGLGVQVLDQMSLEQGVHAQASLDAAEKDANTEKKRLERVERSLDRKREALSRAYESLKKYEHTQVRSQNARDRIKRLNDDIAELVSDKEDIVARLDDANRRLRSTSKSIPVSAEQGAQLTVGEDCGSLETPTDSKPPPSNETEVEKAGDNGDSILSQLMPRRRAAIAAEKRRAEQYDSRDDERAGKAGDQTAGHSADRNAFVDDDDRNDTEYEDISDTAQQATASIAGKRKRLTRKRDNSDVNNYNGESAELSSDDASEDEFSPSDQHSSSERHSRVALSSFADSRDNDDGDERMYQERIFQWCIARWRARRKTGHKHSEEGHRDQMSDERIQGVDSNSQNHTSNIDYSSIPDDQIPGADLSDEPFLPDPGKIDHAIKPHDGEGPPLTIPRQIWDNLLVYQKAGLQWMFALHKQNCGGILGDEMGLGKTVQIVSFLAALYHSQMLHRPSIVVCPATLMRQWVREFHTWWPVLRVVVLHATGYGMKLDDFDDLSSRNRREFSDIAAIESDIWDEAQSENPKFGGSEVTDNSLEESGMAAVMPSHQSLEEYDSTDDYIYDAYGFRVRKKRQSRYQRNVAKKRKKTKKAVTSRVSLKSRARAEKLIGRVHSSGHVIIVTYTGLQLYQDILLKRKWGYAVLDEGHMIRNPDADVTIACKQLDTRHRLLVTGTPIQNNLTELWSLFDFIFPGRLGTLPVFTNQFATPITIGGYASANNLQVRAGYRCACILRDLINPYLLRRLKVDVAQDLPEKTEQVLFCRLTPMQQNAYKSFLRSSDMERILAGRLQMLFGVDVARKICDHPDLLLLSTLPSASATYKEARGNALSSLAGKSGKESESISPVHEGNGNEKNGRYKGIYKHDSDYMPDSDDSSHSIADSSSSAQSAKALPDDYGDWHKSGKLTVVKALLDMWKPKGHKVLIFSQTRQMLDIIERMLKQMADLKYRRMDGSTAVQRRSLLVDEFNNDAEIFVFLLTTKVGGLGINLTGADRIILYSPDWNPSSDMQARERAWRLGQKRDVAIYRLMTAGTIEEKIYNRQIYKQFLSNKILLDPNQNRLFHSQGVRDLFSLNGYDGTEDIVAGAGADDDGAGAIGADCGDRLSANADGGLCDGSASGSEASACAQRQSVTETGRMFSKAQIYPKLSNAMGSSGNDGGDFKAAQLENPGPLKATNAKAPSNVGSIGGVVRLEDYRPEAEALEGDAATPRAQGRSKQPGSTSLRTQAGEPASRDKRTEGDEERVLESLFKMAGVHSALKHDAIIESGGDYGNTELIEEQAERVARNAKAALHESRRARNKLSVSVPTWTGASGQAGLPESSGPQKRFGSRINPSLSVAPPPSIITSNELPAELQYRGLRALGKPSTKQKPQQGDRKRSAGGDSLVYNARSVMRDAVTERRLPQSRAVSSLSLANGNSSARQKTPRGDVSDFGSHRIAGIYHTSGTRAEPHSSGSMHNMAANAPSSASLLANLRARSDGIEASSTAQSAMARAAGATRDLHQPNRQAPLAKGAGIAEQQRRRHGIQRLYVAHRPTATSSDSRVRAFDARKGPSGRGAAQALPPKQGMDADEGSEVVARIKELLEGNGGEVTNRQLHEHFSAEFPLGQLPLLHTLASQVAVLESRPQDESARRTGIGRIVRKIWRLKE